jgi:hypothetical protein
MGAGFPSHISPVRFPESDPLPTSEEEDETFRLLENQDFLFYTDLQQPQWELVPFMLNPRNAQFSKPRLVLVDALTSEVLFGPEYGSDSQPTGTYGSAKLLDLLNQEKRRWQELGSPKLSDFVFEAVPPAHHDHSRSHQASPDIPGQWYLPAPDAGHLDWVIRIDS